MSGSAFAELAPILILPALAVVLWGSPRLFLLVDFLLVLYPHEFHVSAIHFDGTDLALAGAAVALFLGRGGQDASVSIPYFPLWAVLGTVLSLAYLNAEVNAEFLSGSLTDLYQIYRYCWRAVLFYPLAWVLISDRRSLALAILFVTLTGDGMAVMASVQGITGAEATGPFLTKNQLGGAFLVPFFLAVLGLLSASSRLQRGFYFASLVLMARGILFAGSRGAFVSILLAMALLFGLLIWHGATRQRAFRFALGALVFAGTFVLAKPDLLERPTVQMFMSIQHGTNDDNMVWRMENRWPHFYEKAMDHFWFGVGTDVEPEFVEESCPTPHNGYLGVANISGVPSILLLLTLLGLGVWNGVLAYLRSNEPSIVYSSAVLTAALFSVLLHNIVDETFVMFFSAKMYWLATATAIGLARRPERFSTDETLPVADASAHQAILARESGGQSSSLGAGASPARVS